jgi:hypothetical protein
MTSKVLRWWDLELSASANLILVERNGVVCKVFCNLRLAAPTNATDNNGMRFFESLTDTLLHRLTLLISWICFRKIVHFKIEMELFKGQRSFFMSKAKSKIPEKPHADSDRTSEALNDPWSWIPKASDSVFVALLLLFAIGTSFNTLGNGFVFDDSRGIVKNPDVRNSTSLKELFFNDFWGFGNCVLWCLSLKPSLARLNADLLLFSAIIGINLQICTV